MLVKGKVALVTGGASGIGLACAEELLRNDVLGVTIVDINEQNGISAAHNLSEKYGHERVIFVKANIASRDEFEEAFKKTIAAFKHIDILFNNAGIVDEADYDNCLNVNLKGTTYGLKLAIDEYLPKYKTGKDAIIVNNASVAGLGPLNGLEMYSTTKFAIIGLSRNFGCDYHYERTGVKVIVICPGATNTPIVEQTLRKINYKDRAEFFTNVPNAKFQTPEELAKCFIRIVEKEDNGSSWIIEEGKERKVIYPSLFEHPH